MEVEIKESQKQFLIWLTKAESADETLQRRLNPFYKECKAKGFLVAVFHSGTEDLFETMRALLIYNKYRLDEIEQNRSCSRSIIQERAWSSCQSHMIKLAQRESTHGEGV